MSYGYAKDAAALANTRYHQQQAGTEDGDDGQGEDPPATPPPHTPGDSGG